MTRYAAALLLVLLFSGCAVTSEAIETAQTQAAGNDRYTTLVVAALANGTDLERDGIAPVSTDELVKTPVAVRGLIGRLLEALHANRFAAHSLVFQLDAGPDPEGLGLRAVELPAVPDEDDDVLESE